jgi:hypothetical protein
MMFGELTERKQLERAMRDSGRLPPGQSATLKWPVLHVGSVPRFNPQTWDFKITGLVEKPVQLAWDEFSHLPMIGVSADMHCVTRWSRFDVRWEGVAFSEVAKIAAIKPAAKYVMVHAEEYFTSNVPLDDLMRPTSLFALKHNGEPLPADHGYPVRLVVPHLRVEKREVGARDRVHGTRRARILGREWLQHVRRPIPRAALLRLAGNLRASRGRKDEAPTERSREGAVLRPRPSSVTMSGFR